MRTDCRQSFASVNYAIAVVFGERMFWFIKISFLLLLVSFLPLSADAGTIQYTYDSLNRLTKVAYEDSSSLEYSYDSAGNMTRYRANGAGAHHFKITGSSTMQAGGQQEITITACDVSGNTISSYSGDKTLVFSGASASPNPHEPTCADKSGTDVAFGANTILNFSSGTSSSNLKLYKAENAHVKATEGSVTTPDEDDLDITVFPSEKNKLLWVKNPSSPVQAGSVWPEFSIEIADLYGNRTADTDEVTVTPSSGSLEGTSVKGAGAGLASFTDIKCNAASSITIAGSATGLTASPNSDEIVVQVGPEAIIRVEPSGDGNGTVIPDQTLVVGEKVTAYAISRDAVGNFIGNVAADAWSLKAKQGGVQDSDLVPAGDSKSATFTGNALGSAQIQAEKGGLASTASGTITVQNTDPPDPNPMTWASEPNATTSTSISMTATTARDNTNPPVTYFFDFVDSPTGGTGGSDSDWQASTSYADGGLKPNHQYGYRVKARNSAASPSETSFSSPTVYKYTYANAAGTSAFSNVTETAIQANWKANENPETTYYYCENTTNNKNSGWTEELSWKNQNLECEKTYVYRVKARNGDGIETDWTNLGSQTTATCLNSVIYVNKDDETCGGNTLCFTTIQEAIDAAETGTAIKIAQGTYSESISLGESKSLTLMGGWDSTFADQTPNTTILRTAPRSTKGSLKLQMLSIKPE